MPEFRWAYWAIALCGLVATVASAKYTGGILLTGMLFLVSVVWPFLMGLLADPPTKSPVSSGASSKDFETPEEQRRAMLAVLNDHESL
jgi:hypothetical protein